MKIRHQPGSLDAAWISLESMGIQREPMGIQWGVKIQGGIKIHADCMQFCPETPVLRLRLLPETLGASDTNCVQSPRRLRHYVGRSLLESPDIV